VEGTWRSPFVGKTLQEVAGWVRKIPKPPKAISKNYFALLEKELYNQHGKLLIYRRYEGDRVETILVDAGNFGEFLGLFRREDW
jgi:hypothetical protein